MKRAVMYGGGNIGRGFIGALFSQSGYQVTFIDVAKQVVEGLNQARRYPIRIVSNDGHEDFEIENVDAVNGMDEDAVVRSIAECDICATAVGVNVLPRIAPNIAAGIKKRYELDKRPLNIIICENLMNADKLLSKLIRAELMADEIEYFENNVGLVEASIGRMVPVQTPEMQDDEPLRVCVESYGFLPVDKAAFKGEIPDIRNMVPFEPFDFYLKRKLYIHNMGHAVCAYLGGFLGLDFVYESIDNPDIQIIVKNAMLESAQALANAYDMELAGLVEHIDDLLYRFANSALKDTCKRVGGDPRRKLSPDDRLIGAARLCQVRGVVPAHIAIGIAGAIFRLIVENEVPSTPAQAVLLLQEISGLDESDEITNMTIEAYKLLLSGCPAKDLRRLSARIKAQKQGAII